MSDLFLAVVQIGGFVTETALEGYDRLTGSDDDSDGAHPTDGSDGDADRGRDR